MVAINVVLPALKVWHRTHVVVVELVGENGERVAEEIQRTGGKALAFQTDGSKEESVDAMTAEAIRVFKCVDIWLIMLLMLLSF